MQNLPSISPRNSQVTACFDSYGGAENFLNTFNPDMQYSYTKDVERCYTGKAPTLEIVSLTYGEHISETWLEIQLKDLSEFAGCKDKLSIKQIEQLAKVIILEFCYLKVTELMHFFRLFKSGQFGKFYGIVDGLVITEALQEFCDMRNERLRRLISEKEKVEKAKRDADHDKNAMTFEEWQELRHLFNMGYEPWRIKMTPDQ